MASFCFILAAIFRSPMLIQDLIVSFNINLEKLKFPKINCSYTFPATLSSHPLSLFWRQPTTLSIMDLNLILFVVLLTTATNTFFTEGFTATTCLTRASRVAGSSILQVASITDEEQKLRFKTPAEHNDGYQPRDEEKVNIVLVTGFESFNRDLYEKAGGLLPKEFGVNLKGGSDLIDNQCTYISC
jgi:hypothetical protein